MLKLVKLPTIFEYRCNCMKICVLCLIHYRLQENFIMKEDAVGSYENGVIYFFSTLLDQLWTYVLTCHFPDSENVSLFLFFFFDSM